MTTKEKILYEALKLFSVNSYDAVSIRDIAGASGIKESSVYNHYKNKQDIFDSIIAECNGRAASAASSYGGTFAMEHISVYSGISSDTLLQMVLPVLKHFLEDEYTVLFRRLLTISQFENPGVKKVYLHIYYQWPIKFHTEVFEYLIRCGDFLPGDAEQMAVEYYSPLFLLMHTCTAFDEAAPVITRHIKQFAASHIRTAHTHIEEN